MTFRLKSFKTVVGIATLMAMLIVGQASAAVINLSQVPNYNVDLDTSVDSSTDVDADVSTPVGDVDTNADADVNVDANAGANGGSQNDEEKMTENSNEINWTANALSGSALLNIDRTQAESDQNLDANGSVDSNSSMNGSADSDVNVSEDEDVSADANTNANGDVTISADDVETVADLRAYAASTIRSDEKVEAMNFSSNSVEVKYMQDGKFLAILPVSFAVTARANANGEVELDYPWYAFLTVDNSEELETELKVAVDNAMRARTVGSVQAEGEAENPFFTASEQAEIAAQIKAVLETGLDNEAGGQVSG